MSSSMEQLVTAIELAHGRNWSMWCTGLGEYVVEVISDAGEHASFNSGHSLLDGLQQAATHRFLPKISRRPAIPPSRDRFTVAKDGDRWAVLLDGKSTGMHCRTKKEAVEAADRVVERARLAIERWEEVVRPTITGKTEGIDFVYGE